MTDNERLLVEALRSLLLCCELNLDEIEPATEEAIDKAHIALSRVGQASPVRGYCVTVDYRTNSGCNSKTFRIPALSHEEADDIARARVRKMRGVIRIDGAHTVCASS